MDRDSDQATARLPHDQEQAPEDGNPSFREVRQGVSDGELLMRYEHS